MLVRLERALTTGPLESGLLPPAVFGVSRGTSRPKWRVALKLYEQDQIVEAQTVAQEAGAGDLAQFATALGIIDAEARTSAESEITRVSEWMEVERIPDQQRRPSRELGAIAEDAIRKVWAKIGMRIGEPIMITFLAEDVVLPTFVDPTGYVVVKRSYTKYCLPASATEDDPRLSTQVQMLAACHAAGYLSNYMAPPWLICAAEALSDIAVTKESRYGFCSGGTKWSEPSQLNAKLLGQSLGENPVQATMDSLDEAVLIGHYLLEKKGIKTFRDCLTYHSPASIIQYFVLLLSNDATRDACKKLYGFAPEYLFEQALAACCK